MEKLMHRLYGVVLVVLLAFSTVALAQEDCTECHGVDGEPAINVEMFSQSIHGDLSCVDCHEGADQNFDDHPFNLKPVSCTMCHEDVVDALGQSLHAQLKCTQCHTGIHELLPENSVVATGMKC